MPIQKINDSTYKFVVNEVVDVEIGDIDQDHFDPNIKIHKHDEGAWLKISISTTKELVPAEIKVEDNIYQLKWDDDEESALFYPVASRERLENGGFEFAVILKYKPASNILKFDIDFGNIEFLYQPPYNEQPYHQEDIDAGVITRTKTQGLDAQNNVIVDIPEDAIYSYGVYRVSDCKCIENSVKIGHIFRPKLIDNNGYESWGILNINSDTKKLTIEVDQNYLNNAAYPIFVDPTFGYNTIGLTSAQIKNKIVGNIVHCEKDGVIDVFHAALNAGWDVGENVKMALYTNDGELISHQSLERNEGHSVVGWVDFKVNEGISITAGNDYIIALWADSPVKVYRDFGVSAGSKIIQETYGDWPSSIDFSGSNSYYSVYASYAIFSESSSSSNQSPSSFSSGSSESSSSSNQSPSSFSSESSDSESSESSSSSNQSPSSFSSESSDSESSESSSSSNQSPSSVSSVSISSESSFVGTPNGEEIEKINSSTYRIQYDQYSDIEIGDIIDGDFSPHVKIKKWNEEGYLSLKVPTAEENVAQEIEHDNKIHKLKWKEESTQKEVHFYALESNAQMELGGFELEVLYRSKPAGNTVEFDIETKGLKFYKQLPYNQQPDSPEDTLAGIVIKTETQGLDAESKVIFNMPENVINSYAVYKDGFSPFVEWEDAEKYGNYSKAFHIYRPKATDNSGNETWCDLDINTVSKKLTVTVSQEFLDSADYPVIVDPTFGYTTIGAGSFDLNNNNYIGYYGNPGADTEVTSLHAGLGTNWDSGDNVKMALYDTSGNLEYGSESVELSTGHGSDAFVQFNVSAGPYGTDNQDYVVICQADATTALHRDAGSGDQSYYVGQSYGAWVDPVSFLRSANLYSTYATYQAVSFSSESSLSSESSVSSESSDSSSLSLLSLSSDSSLSSQSSDSSISAIDGQTCWGKSGGIAWDDVSDGFKIGDTTRITSPLGLLEFWGSGSEGYGYTNVLKTIRLENFIKILDTTNKAGYIIEMRGSANIFEKTDVSPDWEAYSVPVHRFWRYIQIRVRLPL